MTDTTPQNGNGLSHGTRTPAWLTDDMTAEEQIAIRQARLEGLDRRAEAEEEDEPC
jgi:hypothetical protein